MSDVHSINYSKIFAQLIDKDGRMNDTIASFLFYMFPKELFVRALSLIESGDMFIYVFDRQQLDAKSMEASNSSSTNADGSFDKSSTISVQHNLHNEPDVTSKSTEDLLTTYMYEGETELLYRLIVKAGNDREPSIYVDLTNWFCSCDEYTSSFLEEGLFPAHGDDDLIKNLLKDINDFHEFSNDKFGQLDAHSLSKQRYFLHHKVLCPHLLAFSILLKSSKSVLQYFTVRNSQVLVIPVTNMDEWLKLHINIVI